MRLLTTFLFFFFTQTIFGQLIAIPESAPNLVSTNFLGSNYTISNIYYSGHGYALGKFDATSTNIGLGTGIIMTTGILFNDSMSGPQGPNDRPNSGVDNGMPGSMQLEALYSQQTWNAATLDFDFVPNVDSIVLKFIYGSEEYPEFVDEQFIDPMAIFISGPGISGYKNIGVLPVSNLGINVNSLNNGKTNTGPCVNCYYYHNNGIGTNIPFNIDDTFIQFDGFSSVLEARQMNLQIGNAYHLKIIIADAADGIFDSGIFIESCATCNFNVGLSEIKGDNFSIFPNPVENELSISLNKSLTLKSFQIFDYTGKIVHQGVDLFNKIDVSHLTKGVYLFQIQSTEGIEMIRFIKE